MECARHMRSKPELQNPFGSYIHDKFLGKNTSLVVKLSTQYQQFSKQTSSLGLIKQACALSRFLDENLSDWRDYFGGDSGFSYFRGSFLEEVVLRIAAITIHETAPDMGVEAVKLPSTGGIITGVSFQFRRDRVTEPLTMILRRDREDVAIGFRRTVKIIGNDDSAAQFDNELVPICVIACKMYIDATRLENVLAKASNIMDRHAMSVCLVAADWDALGNDWHDKAGLVLDSLYAPVRDIVFLRGDTVKRPPNDQLKQTSVARPYQAS